MHSAMTEEAYGQAYQQGFERTVRLLLSRGARSECAREAAQAAWVKGWERIHQLRNDNLVSTWVNTIALNCYRSVMRSEHLQLPLPELVTDADVNLAAIDIERILAHCRPRDRQLFEYYLEGHPIEEIARKQGISYTAVRIRFLRARRVVQSRIRESAAAHHSFRNKTLGLDKIAA
jgi:RNA polymerase sigma factor (sigma-70 family)